jgi:hypothetical protein
MFATSSRVITSVLGSMYKPFLTSVFVSSMLGLRCQGVNQIAVHTHAVTSLKKQVESLPPGYHLVGDNAYVLLEHMLIPFSGSQRDDPAKSTYNYFLSQLRIRVAQTFARSPASFASSKNLSM